MGRSGEEALTPEELESFYKVVDDFIDLVMFETAVIMGFRREDLVKLKWSDVDLDKPDILYFEQKKNRTRRLPLNNYLVQRFKMLRKMYPDEYYLFPGHTNKKYGKGHISGRTAYRRFQGYLRKAGVLGEDENKPIHALRATCYKRCQLKGWSVEQAAKWLGDTVRVAQQYYGTPSYNEFEKLVNEKPIL